MADTSVPPSDICSICRQRAASLFCDCDSLRPLLCVSCLPLHTDPASCSVHELYPVSLYPYSQLPGYMPGLKARRLLSDCLDGVLQANLAQLELWGCEMCAIADSFIAKLTEFRQTILLEMSDLICETEVWLRAGIDDFRENLSAPQPQYRCPLAAAVLASPTGHVSILSCQTDFRQLRQAVDGFLFGLNLQLQTDVPGFTPQGYIDTLADINPNRKVNIYAPPAPLVASQQCQDAFCRLGGWPGSKDSTPKILRGPITKPSGVVFTGEWSDRNTAHGVGVAVYPSGMVYAGEFVDQRADGDGVCVWKNGHAYRGGWRRGVQHGLGKHLGADGCVIAEEWVDGLRKT